MLSRPDRPLEQDLARSLGKKGILPQAQAAWVLFVANKASGGRFSAVSFRDGRLLIASGNIPAAELQLSKELFRSAINKKLGQEIVRAIRVKQGSMR